MTFWLGDLPGVMRRQGWTTGANCMDRWFNRGAYTLNLAQKIGQVDYRAMPASQVETRMVTMAWAMRFGRVRNVAEALRASWQTPRSIALLRSRVIRSGAMRPSKTPYDFRFGGFGAPTVAIHATCQANSGPVGGLFDPFDDFYAALGRATMNLAVTGTCHVDKDKVRLSVDGLGIYLRDSYEFIGDQALGYWNRHGVTSVAANVSDIAVTPTAGADPDWSIGIGSVRATIERNYRVTNKSFRDFQQVSHRGGDFVIFTDLLRLSLPSGPIEIAL